jgi:uncharacterized protein
MNGIHADAQAGDRFSGEAGPAIDEAGMLERIRAFAVQHHAGAGPAHDFSHVERVLALAERIARAEGADLFVVRAAALLHDVGRTTDEGKESRGDRHEEESARLAGPLLESLGLDRERHERISAAILRHRHRRGALPERIEERCLFDADKLDSLGAVGAARAYLWLGEYGRSVYYPPSDWEGIDPADNSVEVDSFQREWAIKLSGLADRMTTSTGRALARERHERMRTILAWIEDEATGRS